MKSCFHILFLAAVLTGSVPAQTSSVPAGTPAPVGSDKNGPAGTLEVSRVGIDVMSQRTLSLSEAIELALANNKDIRISRQTARSAKFDVLAARGAYDPKIGGQTYFDRTKTPNISIFSSNPSTTNRTVFGSAGLSGLIRSSGGTYSTTFTSQRVETDNPISLLSPQTNSNINFSLNQPLFRGRSMDQTRRVLFISRTNEALTNAQFEQKSIEVVTNVQRAYWDLVFALRNLQVQRDGLRDSREQLEHNRRLVDQGQLAPNDILASETQVALLEQAVYEAVDIVGKAENALKNLIAVNKDDAIWGQSLIPTDQAASTAPGVNLADSLGSALSSRPEIKVVGFQRDINDTEQKFYRDQVRPQVDFFASYTTAGVGGARNPGFNSPFSSSCQTNPTSPSCVAQVALVNGLVGSSLGDVWASRYPTFRAGVTFNLTVGRKTAEAQLGKAIVQGEQIASQREQAEQLIQVDVRNAMQALQTAEAKLRAATVARENSEKQYESERRKLDAGQSDIYRVLERQTAMLSARSAEIRARVELSKAIADYYRAVGKTLEINGITLK